MVRKEERLAGLQIVVAVYDGSLTAIKAHTQRSESSIGSQPSLAAWAVRSYSNLLRNIHAAADRVTAAMMAMGHRSGTSRSRPAPSR